MLMDNSTDRILIKQGVLFTDTADAMLDIQGEGATDATSSFIARNSAGNIGLQVFNDLSVRISDAFTMPTSDGSANQYLQTDGSGQLSWVTISSGAALTQNYVGFGDSSNLLTGSNDFRRNPTAGTVEVGNPSGAVSLYSGRFYKS